ncbi:MAG TPA: hypothetical protein VJI75_02575 [Candidatus Nanoarchaeia archaeon]|nr:hypothetical protein [Candidatus Nanoarchaeia archaeon]
MESSAFKAITAVSGIITLFISLNSLLYIINGIQRWDYLLANSLAIIVLYLTFITYKINLIEKALSRKNIRVYTS